MLISSISFAEKCHGTKVNDCGTLSHASASDCKNAYESLGNFGVPCIWYPIGESGGFCTVSSSSHICEFN